MHPHTETPAGDPIAIAQTGIRLRNEGNYPEAAQIFKALIDRFPERVYGWQELAVLQAAQGAGDQALRLFRQAARIDPTDFQSCKHLVLHEIGLGRLADARASLAAHQPRTARDRQMIEMYRYFVDYIEAYPERRALGLVDRFEKGGRFLPPAMVEERILAAVADKTPLSLIRLGDGEGAWLSLSPEDEAKFAPLYEANRRKTLKVWFGTDAPYESREFMASRGRLLKAVRDADVIGVPYGLRIAHEYRVLGLNGVASCVNILRALDPADAGKGYCSQDIHVDLHQSGFFPKLLGLPVDVGVVSCHPDLGYRLAKRWGARVTRMLIVPEEMGFAEVADGLSAITGISGLSEPHFPLVYNRILEKLLGGAGQARVWLVAAGYFGKIYCDAIRDGGGVALDVGSIVDGWCGNVTRPYLQSIAAYRL